MTHLLDANACIRYLNGRSQSVRRRFRALRPPDIVICSVVRAEMMAGALRSQQPARTIERQQELFRVCPSLSFDDLAPQQYARIRAHLDTLGTPIGPLDMQIAAIALVHGPRLVTHNTREFSRIPGLTIEDWEAEDAG